MSGILQTNALLILVICDCVYLVEHCIIKLKDIKKCVVKIFNISISVICVFIKWKLLYFSHLLEDALAGWQDSCCFFRWEIMEIKFMGKSMAV